MNRFTVTLCLSLSIFAVLLPLVRRPRRAALDGGGAHPRQDYRASGWPWRASPWQREASARIDQPAKAFGGGQGETQALRPAAGGVQTEIR